MKSSKTRDNLYRKAINKPRTHPAYVKFLKYRNLLNTLKRKAKESYYNNLLDQYKHDIKKTWKILNSITGRLNDKSSVSDVFCIDNTLTQDHKKIADGFCSFFATVGKHYADAIRQSKKTI